MKIRNLLATISVTALCVPMASALAQVPPPPPPGPPGMVRGPHSFVLPPFADILRGVDLKPDQQEKIRHLFESHRQAHRTSMDQIRALDSQIAETLMAKGPVDRTRLAALMKKKDALRAEIDSTIIDEAVQIHDILTPEQLERVKEKRSKLKSLETQIRDLFRP